MISLANIVLVAGIVCLINWFGLFRYTIKRDRQLGWANQPHFGHSTYYLIFSQLVVIIVVGATYLLVDPQAKVAFPADNFWLLALVYALTYLFYNLMTALIQTIIRFVIIEVTSARYKKVSNKEKKENM